MALQFNPNALKAFSSVNLGKNDAIANLDGDGGLVKKGTRGLGVFSKIRFKSTEVRNNAVRTEFLKALGQAFSINGVSEQGSKTHFSAEFMNKLEELLGPAFKRGDFGVDKNGVVTSGKPLTQRRITAIFKAAALVKADTPYDGKTYLAKVDHITNWVKNKVGMDPTVTSTALDFFNRTVRKTIAYLENGINQFTEACASLSDEEIEKFIVSKTRLNIYDDDIRAVLDRQNADMTNEQRLEALRDYVKECLETVVKRTVDACLEAIEANDDSKYVDVINVILKGADTVKYTLRELDKLE